MGESSKERLRPTLGLFDATAIGIGAIIGGGIFVVTGIVAGLAGPGLVISIVISAIIALITALSFVELTAWLPAEGSVYEFAHRLVSPFAGFLTGWMWIISNIFAGAAVSLGFSYYLVALLPGLQPKLVAVALCAAFTAVNYVGVRESATFNNVLVTVKIGILLVFVCVGLFHVNSANFVPFIPSELGVLYGAYFIFFAYGGFARVAVVAEEVRDAKRIVPRSILLALVTSTVIYLMVGIVAVGLVGAPALGKSNSPLTVAISVVGSPPLVYLLSSGGMIATASVLLTSILGVSRVGFAMARRGDLPHLISKLHPRYNTPHISILIGGFLMALIALSVDLTGVVGIGIFAQLFYYGSANASAIRLKKEARRYPRFLPLIGLATCIALLAFVSAATLEIGGACLAVGVAYYIVKRNATGELQTRRENV